MSAEVAATAAPPATELDKNAQAAEEAKKMLAELQGASGSSRTEKTNGNVQKSETNGEDGKAIEESEEKTEDQTEGKKEAKTGEVEAERSDERRQRNEGRSSRGGRGGFQQRNYRENIKSDLTTQKESSDPAAIRKQVLTAPHRIWHTVADKADMYCARLSSTFPTQIFPWTNFSCRRLAEARTILSSSRSSTPSSVCATSNLSRPL